MNEPMDNSKIDTAIRELIAKHNLAIEELTEEQLASAVKQAMECGDFMRHVRLEDRAQSVCYVPFAESERLLSRIKDLESLTDVFWKIEEIRNDGWLVELKCLPENMPWIIEGSRSEYDAPCPDQAVGKGKWVCEISDMGFLSDASKPARRYRPRIFAMMDKPGLAVAKVHEIWDRHYGPSQENTAP